MGEQLGKGTPRRVVLDSQSHHRIAAHHVRGHEQHAGGAAQSLDAGGLQSVSTDSALAGATKSFLSSEFHAVLFCLIDLFWCLKLQLAASRIGILPVLCKPVLGALGGPLAVPTITPFFAWHLGVDSRHTRAVKHIEPSRLRLSSPVCIWFFPLAFANS